MNKKFKELANKAGFTSCTKRMQVLLEAYGEQVVNECARKLENDGMVEVAMELKTHFASDENE